jgi:omega-amidase
VVDTPVGRLGIGICFDIRFSEMAAVQANAGAHVLVYPGAFNTVTGPLHWELLQRARAVDNQLFVLTCSPARTPGGGYQAWGHSTAVGPFGEVLATTDELPGNVYAELDWSQIDARRRAIPLAAQRRGDVYALVDRKRSSDQGAVRGGFVSQY